MLRYVQEKQARTLGWLWCQVLVACKNAFSKKVCHEEHYLYIPLACLRTSPYRHHSPDMYTLDNSNLFVSVLQQEERNLKAWAQYHGTLFDMKPESPSSANHYMHSNTICVAEGSRWKYALELTSILIQRFPMSHGVHTYLDPPVLNVNGLLWLSVVI